MFPANRLQKMATTVSVHLLAAAGAAEVLLTEEGQPRAEIIIAQDAPPEIVGAAEDLRDHLAKISGAELPVVRTPSGREGFARIWIGAGPEVARRLPELMLDWTAPEQFLIAAIPPADVVLAGRDVVHGDRLMESGTRLAVYTFLHEDLDVRWLWPGALGTDVPNVPTLRVPAGERRGAPRLQQRALRVADAPGIGAYFLRGKTPIHADYEACARRVVDEARQWVRRNRAGVSAFDKPYSGHFMMNAGHAFTDWWARYGAAHPEYFAMGPDGSRVPATPRFAKLCVSNPEVVERVLEQMERQLAGNPAGTVSASPNDGWGFCLCPKCRAMDEPDAEKLTLTYEKAEELTPGMDLAYQALLGGGVAVTHVWLTDRYMKFWNTLARRLQERHPDRPVTVCAWAYAAVRKPPVRTHAADNVAIGYVGLGSLTEGITAEDQDRHLREWMAWGDKCQRMLWRPNLYWRNWGLPYLFLERSGRHFKALAEHNMIGLDVDALELDFATQGLQYYVLTQLAWNPFASVDAIVADYCRRGFGPAAHAMRRYYELFERAGMRYEQNRDAHHRNRNGAAYLAEIVYPEADLAAAEALLAEAARLTMGQYPFAERVEWVRIGLEWTRAQMAVARARVAFRRPGAGAGERAEAARQVIAWSLRRDALLRDNLGNHALGPNNLRFYEQQRGPESEADAADLAAPDAAVRSAAASAEPGE